VALAAAVLFSGALVDVPTALAERAVALEHAGVRLRDALRDLLGDDALEIGFDRGSDGLVDDAGLPLANDAPDRVTTPVLVTGQRVAVIVHAPSTLTDAPTRAAVVATVGMAAQRERLRAEASRQVDAVEASRRRLLLAEEQERRRLAERLQRGPGTALAHVEELVADARAAAHGDDVLAGALDRAHAQLEHVQPDLDAPLRGVVAAGQLGPALERLAADLPLDTRVELADVTVSPEVASALWFVCSESLANVVKHADARRVEVALRADDGAVRLRVADDGRGGADPRGSGLVGLADRVAALGGRLAVSSPPGEGTRIEAELPVADAR
jgi:signal transduction histidine kinase